MKRWLPEGTRLVLASEEFLEQLGTRTERGDKITAEWGEQQPKGWYEPIFTVHEDDNLVTAALERLRARVEGLPHTAPFREGRFQRGEFMVTRAAVYAAIEEAKNR